MQIKLIGFDFKKPQTERQETNNSNVLTYIILHVVHDVIQSVSRSSSTQTCCKSSVVRLWPKTCAARLVATDPNMNKLQWKEMCQVR